MILFATWSFAASFQPIVLTLSSPNAIQYNFDGSTLTIPFTVTGTPASVWLVINTKGQAENIVNVQNGYLGWHYVNKIDTTIYISGRFEREPGETSIIWDGNDENGNLATAGDYDYYLWAYDPGTRRQIVCDFINIGSEWNSQHSHIYEWGENGLPLTKPLIMGCENWFYCSDAEGMEYRRHGTQFKWEIGSDPLDLALLQTTRCGIYPPNSELGNPGAFKYGGPVFDPSDFNIFYHVCNNIDGKINTPLKWNFVTDGEAIQDLDWGGWDNITWDDKSQMIGVWTVSPTIYNNRKYRDFMYMPTTAIHQQAEEWVMMRSINYDGEEVFNNQFHEWYMPDDPNPRGCINGDMTHMYSRERNRFFIIGPCSCFHEMVDTSRIVVDPNDDTDRIVFWNQNGDYFMDSAYQENVEPAWYCISESKLDQVRKGQTAIDENGFNWISVAYLGLTSFGVSTQDGTGIGYMSFSDDQIADNVGVNGGGDLCDTGSSFDGLYPSAAIEEGSSAVTGKTFFVAFDSVHGVITDKPVAVEEEGQEAFAVDQNSPNPFNPTTTISFSIPASYHVTVEIFNVAGQKIDTLVNDFMIAGKHSVVWDASGLSAGVYFYMVKSGDFSKTMKMTLLK